MTATHKLHTQPFLDGSATSVPAEFRPVDLWDTKLAAAMTEAQRLVYRSNLLGADRTLTNFGGGNTSAKIEMSDPLTGESTQVLWVKGSGGDLGSMGLDGFATLYLDKVRRLENRYRGRAFEDEMVALQAHCTFGLNGRAASIDTPLHVFIDHPHIDHLHPDSVIALAASHDSEALCRAVYGDTVGWLCWQRPGFDLGLRLRDAIAGHPDWRGVVLEGHGLISWADTGQACYHNSLDLIGKATHFIASHKKGPNFGGEHVTPSTPPQRDDFLTRVTPLLRAALSEQRLKIAHGNSEPAVLEFVCSRDMQRLAELGTSCPDHFLRTKIHPLVLDPDRLRGAGAADYIDASITAYRQAYGDYYARCCRADSPPMRDSAPVIVLIAGYGLIAFADTAMGARIASEYYVNAINVMRGAEAISAYKALDEQEAFDIEYWQLEDAKLKRMPKSGPFAGRIAYITGAAGGIGSAVAEQVLARQGCVVLVDIDAQRLKPVFDRLSHSYGSDNVRMIISDVTQESDVLNAFDQVTRGYGGVDIFVANAGIASAASIEETTLDLWRRNFSVLSEGYFLSVRSAFGAMKARGGAIVFVVSKNGMVASANTAAYSAAKAAEIQLARVLALEGAPHGIRVNIVNPDAVITGSHIWTGAWRSERAAAYNLAEDELENFYRERSLLKRSVLPQDVAAAVVFLASDDSAKSTGNIFNVDGGHAPAFPR